MHDDGARDELLEHRDVRLLERHDVHLEAERARRTPREVEQIDARSPDREVHVRLRRVGPARARPEQEHEPNVSAPAQEPRDLGLELGSGDAHRREEDSTHLELDPLSAERGDADAFARWMAGVEHPLRAGLRRFAGQVDAEAVLQETLLRIWQVAPRFVPDGRPDGLVRLGHRIARVHDQVEDRELDLVGVDQHGRHGGRKIEHDFDLSPDRPLDQGGEAADEIGQAARLDLEILPAGEGQQPLRQVGAAQRALQREAFLRPLLLRIERVVLRAHLSREHP